MHLFLFFPDDGRTKPMPRKGHTESFEPADNKCLIRASDGKRKISTVVSWLSLLCLWIHDPLLLKFVHKLLMLNSCFLKFQVSTKEVIKFQMVGPGSLNAASLAQFFLMSIKDCHYLWSAICNPHTRLSRRTPTSLELTWMDLRRKIRKAKARRPKPLNEQQTL